MTDGPETTRRRPSLRTAMSNWREYDAGFATKLRMALRNNWTKLRTRRDCCGHQPEPGC